MDSVDLNQLFLLEVNYQYESQLSLNNDELKRPLCLLILGVPLNHHKEFQIQRSISIPIRLQMKHDKDGEFVYEVDQVNRRIKLIRETNPRLELCGLMIINEQLYDYEQLIESLHQHFKDQLKYLFTYNPELHTDMSNKLSGFILLPRGQRRRISYTIIYGKVDMETQKTDSLTSEFSDKERMRQESLFTEKLTREIDKMIQYLDRDQPSDLILRKISLLVSQLRKGPTPDVQETIMNKESEINALRIICDQWEMGIELGNN